MRGVMLIRRVLFRRSNARSQWVMSLSTSYSFAVNLSLSGP